MYTFFEDLEKGDIIHVYVHALEMDITVFICDASEFAKWSRGEKAWVYELHEDIVTVSIEFPVPHGGSWYVVFDNTDNLFSVTIEYDVYVTRPIGEGGNPSAMLMVGLILLIIIVIVIVVAVAIWAVHSKKAQPTYWTYPPGVIGSG